MGETHVRLSRALTQALSGHLSVCGGCGRVRGSGQGWEEVESYVRRQSETDFSHSICPACRVAHYP